MPMHEPVFLLDCDEARMVFQIFRGFPVVPLAEQALLVGILCDVGFLTGHPAGEGACNRVKPLFVVSER
jgi:hypothetical protein